MKLKSIFLPAVIVSLLGGTAQATPLTLETINTKLGSYSRLTGIQKEHAWRSFDEKQISITGSIEDVGESLGGNPTLTITIGSGPAQGKKGLVSLLERFKSKALNLSRGQQVKLMGKLKYFNGIPNMMGMADQVYGDAYLVITDAILK